MSAIGFLVPPIASISLTDTAADAADLTTYTFTSRSIGAAEQSRFIIVGSGQRNSGQTIVSMTIGGVTASLIKRQVGASGFNVVELWGAYVPTGTTATISITWSSAIARCAIAVYRAVYLQSSTAVATYSSTADPMATSINVPDGGVAVAFSYGAANTTNTWTGLTEDVDSTVESQCYSSASASFVAAQTSLSVSCDGGIAFNDPAMVVAVLR